MNDAREIIRRIAMLDKLPNGTPIKGQVPPPGHVDRIPPHWTALQLYAYQTGYVARDEVRGWLPQHVERWGWLVYEVIAHCNQMGWAWTQSNVLGEMAHWKSKVWATLQERFEKEEDCDGEPDEPPRRA